MPAMSIDKEIKKHLPELDSEEKQSLLSVIRSFLKLKNTLKQPQRLTIEQYNKELDEAVARMEAGEFYTQDEAKKIAESWF